MASSTTRACLKALSFLWKFSTFNNLGWIDMGCILKNSSSVVPFLFCTLLMLNLGRKNRLFWCLCLCIYFWLWQNRPQRTELWVLSVKECGLVHLEKTADKWGKNGNGDEWQEKWWEHYDASGQAEKWAHKWCSIDPNTLLEAGHAHIWHERYQTSCLNWIKLCALVPYCMQLV